MMNRNSKIILVWGILVSLISLLVRLNARAIAWPKNPGWHALVGNAPIEGSEYYITQLAVADISNLSLAFGLLLIGGVVIRQLFVEK
jgi:hypothetical protein